MRVARIMPAGHAAKRCTSAPWRKAPAGIRLPALFVPFSVLYMQQPLKLDYLWAGLCMVGAVYFIFRA